MAEQPQQPQLTAEEFRLFTVNKRRKARRDAERAEAREEAEAAGEVTGDCRHCGLPGHFAGTHPRQTVAGVACPGCPAFERGHPMREICDAAAGAKFVSKRYRCVAVSVAVSGGGCGVEAS